VLFVPETDDDWLHAQCLLKCFRHSKKQHPFGIFFNDVQNKVQVRDAAAWIRSHSSVSNFILNQVDIRKHFLKSLAAIQCGGTFLTIIKPVDASKKRYAKNFATSAPPLYCLVSTAKSWLLQSLTISPSNAGIMIKVCFLLSLLL